MFTQMHHRSVFIKVFVELDLGVCALRTAFLQCDMAFVFLPHLAFPHCY